MNNIPTMMTKRQAARETGLSYRMISDLVKADKIVYVQVGNRTLINFDKLVEYLQVGEGGQE